MTTQFPRKTYECQWQVVRQQVDQYNSDYGPPTILSRWATYEEAAADLPNHGEYKPELLRWVPFENDGFTHLKAVYREIPVKVETPFGHSGDLRKALEPFVRHYEPWMERLKDDDSLTVYPRQTMGDLRRARAALADSSGWDGKVDDLIHAAQMAGLWLEDDPRASAATIRSRLKIAIEALVKPKGGGK